MELTQADSRRPIVLVVEDDAQIANLLRLTLQAKGHTVLVAADGSSALGLLKERGNAIDVLFTDVSLPHTNGLDLITVVQGQWPGIKIIVCSGQLSEAELANTGAVFLPKPFTTFDVYSALDQVMQSPLRTATQSHKPLP